MADELKKRVAARLAELDRNAFEAARLGDLERSFVNDILNGKKKSVQGLNLAKLAKALDWTISELVEGGTQIGKVTAPRSEPLLYRDQLADSDSIQVAIGDLRRVAVRVLRREDVSERQAKAVANVLVATLSAHPNSSVVLRLGARDRSKAGFPERESADPT